MIDRWIRSNRIGLAAYRLSILSANNAQTSKLGDFRAILESELNVGCSTYRLFEEVFPPIVLRFLLSIPQGRLGPLRNRRVKWEAILSNLNENEPGSFPSAIASQVLAHHILQGTGTPISILRLARSALGTRHNSLYEKNKRAIEALDLALDTLRSSFDSTGQKIQAIDKLLSPLWQSHLWQHTGNVLYHQVFSWPLLFFGSSNATSLPVMVDVFFDGKAETKVIDNGFTALKWISSLNRATQVARLMWRSKHGNYGSFRREVESASVVFDFRIAEKIADGFPEQIRLSDRSMEAYFSQVILSRLLGNTVSSSSVVTGSIGQQRFEEFGDFEFNWPAGIEQKLNYVFGAQFFERVILPDINQLNKTDGRRKQLAHFTQAKGYKHTTEINFVKHLQHVADAFQTTGWRQFRYVRCPDIAWQIHPSGSRLPSPDSKQVKECLRTLRNNKRSVLDLSGELNPVTLASALWHVNTNKREGIPLSQGRPPMFSWAFIRVIPEEQDARFWQVIWDIIGAPLESFDVFQRSATSETATRCLAEALNRFEPRQSSPTHRAPDILVIFGTKHFDASLDESRNSLFRSLAFEPILQRLRAGDLLQPITHPEMRKFLGNTRIIIFADDSIDESDLREEGSAPTNLGQELLDCLSLLRLEQTQRDLLNILSVFRFGFTQQMASIVWKQEGYKDLPVRILLDWYVQRNLLCYTLGEYYIPGRVSHTSFSSNDGLKDAQRHFAAALAFAPYISTSGQPGLAYDESFHPDYVHEANYHLVRAYRLLGSERKLRATIMRATTRLLRFAEHPGWEILHQLLRKKVASKDIYEMAMQLLEDPRVAGRLTHPVHILLVAKAVEVRWNDLKKSPSFKDPEYLQQLLENIQTLFDQAEQACNFPIYESEEEYNRLKVITSRALFLMQYECFLGMSNVGRYINELNTKALELIRSGTDGSAALGEWYENVGDRLENHKEAEEIYRQGVRWVPKWYSLWIKLIGSCYVRYASKDKAKAIINELAPDDIDKVLYYASAYLRQARNYKPQWVKERTFYGAKQLRSLYGNDPVFHMHFSKIDKELTRWQF